ncbi:hypothetical protein CCP2SC5_240018 [Azospirillaceae bacterium]
MKSDFQKKNCISVLVVDRNRHLRFLIKKLLNAQGVNNVFMVDDAAQALQFIRADLVDIVFSDDEQGGLGLLEMVRSGKTLNPEEVFNERYRDIPFVVVTSQTEKNIVDRAIELGIHGFIVKNSLSINSVKGVIERIIGFLERENRLPFRRTGEEKLVCIHRVFDDCDEIEFSGAFSLKNMEIIKDVFDKIESSTNKLIKFNFNFITNVDEYGIGCLMIINGVCLEQGKNLKIELRDRYIMKRMADMGVNRVLDIMCSFPAQTQMNLDASGFSEDVAVVYQSGFDEGYNNGVKSGRIIGSIEVLQKVIQDRHRQIPPEKIQARLREVSERDIERLIAFPTSYDLIDEIVLGHR